MKNWLPKAVIISVALSTVFSFVSGESLSGLREMRGSLDRQKARNSEMKNTVGSLKSEVDGLQSDRRALERAARNELAMIRPNEEIIIFEKN